MSIVNLSNEKLNKSNVEFYIIPTISLFKSKDVFIAYNLEVNIYWINFKWNKTIYKKVKENAPIVKIINKKQRDAKR